MIAILSPARSRSLAAYRAHQTRARLARESQLTAAARHAAARRAHVTRRLQAGTITRTTAAALRAHITRELLAA